MDAPFHDADIELEALYAEYARIKPQFDELEERFKAVKDAIKVKLTMTYPGKSRIDVEHPALPTPMKLAWIPRWNLNTKAMKEKDPELYVRYAEKGGRWEWRPQ